MERATRLMHRSIDKVRVNHGGAGKTIPTPMVRVMTYRQPANTKPQDEYRRELKYICVVWVKMLSDVAKGFAKDGCE